MLAVSLAGVASTTRGLLTMYGVGRSNTERISLCSARRT